MTTDPHKAGTFVEPADRMTEERLAEISDAVHPAVVADPFYMMFLELIADIRASWADVKRLEAERDEAVEELRLAYKTGSWLHSTHDLTNAEAVLAKSGEKGDGK